MKALLIGLTVATLGATAYAQELVLAEPRVPDIATLSDEQIEKLPLDVLLRMPAREMLIRAMRHTKEVPNPESLVDVVIRTGLRELYYVAPVQSLSAEQAREGLSAFRSDIESKETGEMTIGEFQKLAVRGLRRRDTPAYAGDHVLVQILESYAVANGTWIIEGDDIYYPINTSKVECDRDRDTCVITKADVQIPNVDGDDNAYHLGLSSETFEVISWSRDEIIARALNHWRRHAERPC